MDVVAGVWVGGCGGEGAENNWVEKQRDKREKEREKIKNKK